MQVIKYPDKQQWQEIVARPTIDNSNLFGLVQDILSDIKQRGDEAVKEYSLKFDKVQLSSFEVSKEEKDSAEAQLSEELKKAILVAKDNISKFHSSQIQSFNKVETSPGVVCWQKASAIERVGLYIPGGTAPLFSSVLMLAIPAKIAGCKYVTLCTPPNEEGKVHPAILFAAKVAGVDNIYKVGGVQAIAAMAYGTQSIPKVYKIFGPGNQYVTAAKQLVSLKDVAIDMPAGPSEVEVIADDSANPCFVAADMLSQAEHGADSQAVLLTTSEDFANKVEQEVYLQLDKLPRKELAAKSVANSKIIILKNNDEVIELTNYYAPEHLIIETENYKELSEQIVNAGSVFLGHYTPESAGDYASGTNHTLPTNGYAKAYSGVNLDSYIKKITFQEITREGLTNLAPTIEIMAENESLVAHKNAVTFRVM
ncbi:histidinol dehydrogenase [Dysgonomonadaceae bacterium PH5-43]|nr:histidinol dehydrogenase [Dysgonomonadaceae bacterium PH5-43]